MLPVDLAIFAPLIWRWAQCSQVRTNGLPVAASLWAISSSWCGKIRSTPPVWMSNDCAEVLHPHRRALDVPARPAGPDRGVPRRLAGLRALPEREVADVVLAVLVGLDPLADAQLLRVEPGEPAVRRPRGDPEEDRAVVGPVGVALARGASRSGATMSSMCSVARGRTSGRVIRSAAASARKRSSQRSASSPIADARGRRAADDLVVDVGDVHHPRDPQAAVRAGSGRGGRRTGSSGSCRCGPGRRPSGRSCRSGRGRARAARAAGSRPTACPGGGSSSEPVATTRDRVGRDRPGRRPRRRQVAGRGLDVDRGRVDARGARRSPRRIASRWPASRGRAPTIVTSTAARSRPGVREPARRRSRRARALAIPRGVAGPAGNSRPRSPSPAAPSSASATAWSATSPSEWPWRRGAPSIATPPSMSGPPGPNGWLS